MSKPQLRVDSEDLRRTIATLNHLPKGLRNRAIRIGLNKAGSMARANLNSSNVPVDTGKLVKSFAVKVKQKKSTGDWAMTVGANRKAGRPRKSKKVTRSMFKFFQPQSQDTKKKRRRTPANYLHLLENGTKRGVKAHYFMRRALQSIGPSSIKIVQDRIIAEINSGVK